MSLGASGVGESGGAIGMPPPSSSTASTGQESATNEADSADTASTSAAASAASGSGAKEEEDDEDWSIVDYTRMIDYFGVVGMDEEDEEADCEPLEGQKDAAEALLEAWEHSITDMVACVEGKEEVPPGYTLVETTVSGKFKADLNHGAMLSSSILLAIRRQRTSQGNKYIAGVRVVTAKQLGQPGWKGNESGWQLMCTASGKPANLNKSAGRTSSSKGSYLALRVVERDLLSCPPPLHEVCVVLPQKDPLELPPPGFALLSTDLNEDRSFADVVKLGYLTGPGISACSVPYRSAVLQRHPDNVSADRYFPREQLPMFIFPEGVFLQYITDRKGEEEGEGCSTPSGSGGALLGASGDTSLGTPPAAPGTPPPHSAASPSSRWPVSPSRAFASFSSPATPSPPPPLTPLPSPPTAPPEPAFFTFVFTNIDGQHNYAAALVFYEPLSPANVRRLATTTEEAILQAMQRAREGEGAAGGAGRAGGGGGGGGSGVGSGYASHASSPSHTGHSKLVEELAQLGEYDSEGEESSTEEDSGTEDDHEEGEGEQKEEAAEEQQQDRGGMESAQVSHTESLPASALAHTNRGQQASPATKLCECAALKEGTIYAPKAICVITRVPIYNTLDQLLHHLYDEAMGPPDPLHTLGTLPSPLHRPPSASPAIRISALLRTALCLPMPPPGGRAFELILEVEEEDEEEEEPREEEGRDGEEQQLTERTSDGVRTPDNLLDHAHPASTTPPPPVSLLLKLPPSTWLPYTEVDFEALFGALSIPNIIGAFTLMLNEERLLFLSSKQDVLTSSMEALRSLLFPLEWQSLYVPRLPRALYGCLEAPGGFMLGIPLPKQQMGSSTTQALRNLQLEGIAHSVNLDTDEVVLDSGVPFSEALSTERRRLAKLEAKQHRRHVSASTNDTAGGGGGGGVGTASGHSSHSGHGNDSSHSSHSSGQASSPQLSVSFLPEGMEAELTARLTLMMKDLSPHAPPGTVSGSGTAHTHSSSPSRRSGSLTSSQAMSLQASLQASSLPASALSSPLRHAHVSPSKKGTLSGSSPAKAFFSSTAPAGAAAAAGGGDGAEPPATPLTSSTGRSGLRWFKDGWPGTSSKAGQETNGNSNRSGGRGRVRGRGRGSSGREDGATAAPHDGREDSSRDSKGDAHLIMSAVNKALGGEEDDAHGGSTTEESIEEDVRNAFICTMSELLGDIGSFVIPKQLTRNGGDMLEGGGGGGLGGPGGKSTGRIRMPMSQLFSEQAFLDQWATDPATRSFAARLTCSQMFWVLIQQWVEGSEVMTGHLAFFERCAQVWRQRRAKQQQQGRRPSWHTNTNVPSVISQVRAHSRVVTAGALQSLQRRKKDDPSDGGEGGGEGSGDEDGEGAWQRSGNFDSPAWGRSGSMGRKLRLMGGSGRQGDSIGMMKGEEGAEGAGGGSSSAVRMASKISAQLELYDDKAPPLIIGIGLGSGVRRRRDGQGRGAEETGAGGAGGQVGGGSVVSEVAVHAPPPPPPLELLPSPPPPDKESKERQRWPVCLVPSELQRPLKALSPVLQQLVRYVRLKGKEGGHGTQGGGTQGGGGAAQGGGGGGQGGRLHDAQFQTAGLQHPLGGGRARALDNVDEVLQVYVSAHAVFLLCLPTAVSREGAAVTTTMGIGGGGGGKRGERGERGGAGGSGAGGATHTMPFMMAALGVINHLQSVGAGNLLDEMMWRYVLVAAGRIGGELMRLVAAAIFEAMRAEKIAPNSITYGLYTKALGENNANNAYNAASSSDKAGYGGGGRAGGGGGGSSPHRLPASHAHTHTGQSHGQGHCQGYGQGVFEELGLQWCEAVLGTSSAASTVERAGGARRGSVMTPASAEVGANMPSIAIASMVGGAGSPSTASSGAIGTGTPRGGAGLSALSAGGRMRRGSVHVGQQPRFGNALARSGEVHSLKIDVSASAEGAGSGAGTLSRTPPRGRSPTGGGGARHTHASSPSPPAREGRGGEGFGHAAEAKEVPAKPTAKVSKGVVGMWATAKCPDQACGYNLLEEEIMARWSHACEEDMHFQIACPRCDCSLLPHLSYFVVKPSNPSPSDGERVQAAAPASASAAASASASAAAGAGASEDTGAETEKVRQSTLSPRGAEPLSSVKRGLSTASVLVMLEEGGEGGEGGDRLDLASPSVAAASLLGDDAEGFVVEEGRSGSICAAQAENRKGSISGHLADSVEGRAVYLSPMVLRHQLERLVVTHGEQVLTMECVRRYRRHLFWNVVWLTTRLGLPMPLFLSESFEVEETVVIGSCKAVVSARCRQLLDILSPPSPSPTPSLASSLSASMASPGMQKALLPPLPLETVFSGASSRELKVCALCMAALLTHGRAGLSNVISRLQRLDKQPGGGLTQGSHAGGLLSTGDGLYLVVLKLVTFYRPPKAPGSVAYIQELRRCSGQPPFEQAFVEDLLQMVESVGPREVHLQGPHGQGDEADRDRESPGGGAAQVHSISGKLLSLMNEVPTTKSLIYRSIFGNVMW